MNIDLTAPTAASRRRPATAGAQTSARLGLGLNVASHSLYSPRAAAIRSSEIVRPLTATQPGAGASRRYMLSDNSAYTARPSSQSLHTDSQFSSPNLLKQMAGLQMASRRDDYPGHENAKLVEIDSAANAAAYARARGRASSTWSDACVSSPPIDSPARGEEVTPEGDAKHTPWRKGAALPNSTLCPGGGDPAVGAAVPRRENAGNARRRLQLRDASTFYAARGPSTVSLECKSHASFFGDRRQPLASSSISRQHAIAAARSDPFGHTVSGRGHWNVGPTIP